MKRILAILAALVLVFSLVACGNDVPETPNGDETPAATTPSESTPDESTPDATQPSTSERTMGQQLLDHFNDYVGANSEATVEEIANELLTNDVIQFMSGAMPVENDTWLQGFRAETMGGFKSGAMFGPMMGSIAFIGYVFELEEGADIDAFMQTLEDNADPRWQLCVTADETVIEKNGNLVFFLMCDNTNLNG